MSLSASTLMLAIRCVDREIRRWEVKLRKGDLNEEDSDYYGHYVLDLTRALGDLGTEYEAARAGNTNLPTVDALLAGTVDS
jgi:hypothetical protein